MKKDIWDEYKNNIIKNNNERFIVNNYVRFDYNLDKNSIIFDLGCNIGSTIFSFNKKFKCYIYGFEVVSSLYEVSKKRFKDNDKIKIYNYGLGNSNKKINIYMISDSGGDSSQYTKKEKRRGNPLECKIRNFIEFVKEEKINTIDLIKINIEGGEYELLEYLTNEDYIKNISNIQISFHTEIHGVYIPNEEERRINIQNKLLNTHNMTWCYPKHVESWKLKK